MGERVLLLTHWAPNILLFRRGLLEILKERGDAVVVVAPECSEFPHDELHAMGVETIGTGGKRNALTPWGRRTFEQGIRRAIVEWKPTLAISFSHFANHSFGNALPENSPVRWTAVITGMGRLFIPRTGIAEWGRRLLKWGLVREAEKMASRARAILTLNPDDLKELQSWGPECAAKGSYLPLGEGVRTDRFGIDAELRRQWRTENGYTDDDFVCGYIGRLMPEKGADFFAELAQASTRPEMKWGMAGRSDLGGGLKFYNKIQCLSRTGTIRLLPWQKDPSALYNGIDLLIYPSIREGLPIVPLEVLASGTPVLLADTPGSRELTGSGCKVLPTRDISLWLKAVEEKAKIRGEELQHRQAACRAYAKQFENRKAMGELLRRVESDSQ